MSKPVTPTDDPEPLPIAASEVVGWFKDAISDKRPRPTIEHVAGFVALLNQGFGHYAEASRRPADSAHFVAVQRTVWEANEAIEALAEKMGQAGWRSTGAMLPHLPKLRTALAEAVSAMGLPHPRKRGRPNEYWHVMARIVADGAVGVLQLAGWSRASRAKDGGPVTQVGAEAMTRILGRQIEQHAFAAAVRSKGSKKQTRKAPTMPTK